MDPKWNVMKAILYLCDVDRSNGPFTVIPGSNRWHYNEFERVVAAGNSVGNYLSSPDHRYVMSCFPPEMTKNVIMGNYFDDGSPMSNLLLSQMHQYTSDEADVILFDPAHTIHRGGLCDTGDRVNLQIIMR
jgi:ectoine hydroxylase-related dioxygenase (phytanoyl-CoA dioxygenase family)